MEETHTARRGSRPTSHRTRRGPLLIGVLVVLLIVLHQDYWFWENDSLVFGWAPVGLFYHACLSLLASLVWLLATKIAWPVETIRQVQAAEAPAVTPRRAGAGPGSGESGGSRPAKEDQR